jgi:CshA-type fibril repeat protein
LPSEGTPRPSGPRLRAGAAFVAAALATGGSLFVAPQAAVAADPFDETEMLATQSNSSNIVALDRATGATNTILTVPEGATGLNQIGVSGDGNTLMLTNTSTIFEYTASSEAWETTPRSGATVANTMGGVDPVSGRLYFGGQDAGTTFRFTTYDPATNAVSTSAISVTAPGAPGANGDVAFDSLGNLYFVSSSAQAAQLYRVDAERLDDAGTITAVRVGPVIDSGVALNSMAFADDGFVYIAGSGANGFLRVNPTTGAVLERRSLSVGITDLGTNAVPFTAAVTTELPNGRFDDGDQFTVTIGGGGITTGNTGTTTGTETSETVGPLLILPGETYTIEQTPAGTTDPANYDTTWSCIDPSTGETIVSGTGTSGEFTIPDGVRDVECTFTSIPKAAPAASDDESLDNAQGTPVSVDVVGNDEGDLDPTTVRLVDGDGDPVTELVVPGEGTWTVDTETGDITFTPEDGFSGNPTPVTYEVSDVRGNTTTADVVITFAPEAIDDESLGNAQGAPVAVDVIGNDLGELDPTTVRVVDGSGDPVTELVVPGEGTWTVDPVTGAITFTPEDGFSGNPTVIGYRVSDTLGNVTTADVLVTYVPGAIDDESLNNTQGDPVTVAVLGNDLGDFDSTTVRILDVDGDPVTDLVVPGEGTWTVDPGTGAITFTPEDGFSGNPTPITYEVSDTAGSTTTAAVTITFAPEAIDDESLGNRQGESVAVDVIGNDLGDLDPTTVRIIGGEGAPVTELVVPGEGAWTVDPSTGVITFTPEEGFSGNPTPVAYAVTDVVGSTTDANVRVTFVPEAIDDQSLDNAQGEPVTIDALGNDLGDLDPTSVRLIDGAGDPVTELVVPGEGTWSVDPETGAITFTPEDSFSGNPTVIGYEVGDTSGNTTTADVLVTFVPEARDDESLDNVFGEPVTVDVIGNDLGELDPTTVRIIDGEGERVTELVVDGEGVWSVDSITGAITFTPEEGFSGDPTPIAYEVSDTAGNTTTADVTVTFAEEAAVPAPQPTDPPSAPDDDAPAPAPDLAVTGTDALGLVVAGLGLALFGLALVLVRRRYQN